MSRGSEEPDEAGLPHPRMTPVLFTADVMVDTCGTGGDVIMAITIAEIPRVSRLVRGRMIIEGGLSGVGAGGPPPVPAGGAQRGRAPV